MLTSAALESIDRASVGVLGFVDGAGRPRAVAVTPYVVEGQLVVTSTLALIDKALAVAADPRVTLCAGGVAISGTARVRVALRAGWFDRHLRRQELDKYPPSRTLLRLPLHRRWLWWYVGRVVMVVEPAEVVPAPEGDRTTLTVLDTAGTLRTTGVAAPPDPDGTSVELPPGVPAGPALLLVHEEDTAMRDLRQLALHGDVVDGRFRVARRTGSLARARPSTWSEIARLRRLGRRARGNRERLTAWAEAAPA